MSLRSDAIHLPDYTKSHPSIQSSSKVIALVECHKSFLTAYTADFLNT
jgi:hypothetical protein